MVKTPGRSPRNSRPGRRERVPLSPGTRVWLARHVEPNGPVSQPRIVAVQASGRKVRLRGCAMIVRVAPPIVVSSSTLPARAELASAERSRRRRNRHPLLGLAALAGRSPAERPKNGPRGDTTRIGASRIGESRISDCDEGARAPDTRASSARSRTAVPSQPIERENAFFVVVVVGIWLSSVELPAYLIPAVWNGSDRLHRYPAEINRSPMPISAVPFLCTPWEADAIKKQSVTYEKRTKLAMRASTISVADFSINCSIVSTRSPYESDALCRRLSSNFLPLCGVSKAPKKKQSFLCEDVQLM